MVRAEVGGLAVWHRPARPATGGEGEERGSAAPGVVLVHGTMDRASSMRKLARRLPDLDVTTYDRRGYGESREAGVAPTVAAHVDDLLAVVVDRDGGAPVLVVGHSFGGTLALVAAQRRPDLVAGVLAYESPLSWEPWWPADGAGSQAVQQAHDPAEAAEVFMRRVVGDGQWERLPAATRAARRAEGPAMLAEMAALRRDGRPFDPTALRLPVAIAHGTESRPHHQRGARALAGWLPSAELVVVEGADHGAHLTHPDALAELTRALRTRLADPPASPAARTITPR